MGSSTDNLSALGSYQYAAFSLDTLLSFAAGNSILCYPLFLCLKHISIPTAFTPTFMSGIALLYVTFACVFVAVLYKLWLQGLHQMPVGGFLWVLIWCSAWPLEGCCFEFSWEVDVGDGDEYVLLCGRVFECSAHMFRSSDLLLHLRSGQ